MLATLLTILFSVAALIGAARVVRWLLPAAGVEMDCGNVMSIMGIVAPAATMLLAVAAGDPAALALFAAGAAALVGAIWHQSGWQFRPPLGGVLAALVVQWLASATEPFAVLALPRGAVVLLGAIGAGLLILTSKSPRAPRRPERAGRKNLVKSTLSPRLAPAPLAAA